MERDEVIAELESEKATFEVNAEQAGVLTTAAAEGDTLKIGDLLASIDDKAAKPEKKTAESTKEEKTAAKETTSSKTDPPKSNGQEKKEKKKE